ncbi:MAG: hypothetical protein ACTS3F_05355 [Phycisphaerales bacterium]
MSILLPGWSSSRSWIDAAKFIAEWTSGRIAKLDVSASRVVELCDFIESCNYECDESDSGNRWRRAAAAIRDVYEIEFIIESIGEDLLCDPYLEPFRVCVGGNVLQEASNNEPHDRQFELVVAAGCRRVGLEVTRPALPVSACGTTPRSYDWIVRVPDRAKKWHIECKRLNSTNLRPTHLPSPFWGRMRDANGQFNSCAVSGLVVMDVSNPLVRADEALIVKDKMELEKAGSAGAEDLAKMTRDAIHNWPDKLEKVIGVMLYAVAAARHSSGGPARYSPLWARDTFSPPNRESAEVREFFKLLHAGLPGRCN